MSTPNLRIKARDIMNTRIVAVTREYNARSLSILIHSGNFSGVPVIEPGNHLVGMVTEFDVLNALINGKDLHNLQAEEIMSLTPVTVEETATAQEIAHLMISHTIIRIPVVREGRLLGIVSRTDILDHVIDKHVVNIYGGS